MLKELEAQLETLPEGSTKHDMEPGFAAMAEWVASLDGDKRSKVLSELPKWLAEDHPWHSRAAMEIAVRLGDRALLEAAVREAERRGVQDFAANNGYPPWLIFHLDLLSTLSRWQGTLGKEALTYLEQLRLAAIDTSDYPRRLLGIRAWFTQCLLEKTERQEACLRPGMDLLRGWQDARLLRSGLSLLHAYFATTARGVALLEEVLTPEEFARACPEFAQS